MKKLLLFIGCSFFISAVKSQVKDKIAVDGYYNAYHLSKELVAIERKANLNPLQVTKNERERLFAYLVWYANLQDYTESASRITGLDSALKKYKKLRSLYVKVYSSVSNFERLFDMDKTEFNEEFVKPLKLDTNYSNVLSNYIETHRKLKNDSIKLSENIDLVEKRIKESERNLAIKKEQKSNSIDSVSFENELKELDSLIKKDSIILGNYKKTQKSVNDKLNVARDNIINAYNQKGSLNIKQAIENYQITGSSKKIDLSENTIQQYVKQIQYAHEVVLNEAQQSTLQFKLPSQADMIDALAIYLAKRVKQESVMWFFETIKKNAENYELVKAFFPATIALLQSNEVYEIPNLGTQWRYALSKDFVKMPRNVLSSDWIDKWFPNKTEEDKLIFEYINTGFDISDLLLQRYSYRDLVRQIYLQTTSANTNSKGDYLRPKDIFSLLYGINEECFILSPIDTTYRLLQYEDFRLMNKDEIEVMLSLIDMKYGGSFLKIYKHSGATFEITNEQIESVRKWLGSVEIGIGQFKKIQNDFNQTQEDVKNGKKEEAVYSVLNLWENVNTLFDLVMPNSTYKRVWMNDVSKQSEKIKKFTKNGFEVYNQISLKNYAGATNTMLLILEDLFYYKDSVFRIDTEVLKNNLSYIKRVSKTDKYYPAYLERILKNELVKSTGIISFKRDSIYAALIFERERHAIQLIRKLSGFLNDVMLTKDPGQLSKVVESYALPPGSYKRKRNSWWSLDVNAYVGIYGGYEIARKNKAALTDKPRSDGWVYGITAPIGLSLSRTFGKKINANNKINEAYIRNPDKLRVKKNGLFLRSNSTLTLSVNIIDIGAVVSYRFNNTQDSILPQQLKWEQVISPGIHLSYGIKNTPLAISAGYQYTPLLRRIGETQIDSKANQFNTSRVQVGLLFDLPLANVWQLSFYKPILKKMK